MTPKTMTAPEPVKALNEQPGTPKVMHHPDLSWMDCGTEWGIKAIPGKKGLTIDAINIGSYGEVPEHSDARNMRARGSKPYPGAPSLGYTVLDKADVWADNLGHLYEEAVQRQWSSATDIPWHTIEPLPDDLERAMCQVCTTLSEIEFVAGDAPGQWLSRISYDYHEVKLFLATQIFDEARHLDVFRKRALVNGGGLLQQGLGKALKRIMEARDYTEMSVMMHILGEGFVQTLFRFGEYIAQNEAEKKIFRLCMQDESRHVAYGVMHLKYLLQHQPERREEIHTYCDEGESVIVAGLTGLPMAEAMSILLGGGKNNIELGWQRLQYIRQKQVVEYLHRLAVAGMPERRERVHPRFANLLELSISWPENN